MEHWFRVWGLKLSQKGRPLWSDANGFRFEVRRRMSGPGTLWGGRVGGFVREGSARVGFGDEIARVSPLSISARTARRAKLTFLATSDRENVRA